MSSWHSYPKVWNLGHPSVEQLLSDPVLVEEKVDGSQFSFGLFGEELRVRSKGKEMVLDAPEKMFDRAIETVVSLRPLLRDGWTYRCEYLRAPKHNALNYDRAPNKYLIVFDVNTSEEKYLSYDEKAQEASRLGLEVVPRLMEGSLSGIDQFLSMMERESVLGGQKIEGVVIKNYSRFGPDGKALLGKHVREDFREVNASEWKKSNPMQGDVLERLCQKYNCKARWEKAVLHMAERGGLTHSPKDIGALLKEAQSDISSECSAEIAKELVAWAMPHILRRAIAGMPEWYKAKLVERQFNAPTPAALGINPF